MPILCRHVWGPKTLEASCWIPIWLFNKRTNRDFQKGIPNSHPSCSLRTFEVYFYLRCSSKIKACRSLASPGLSGESTPSDGHCTMLLGIRSVCVCVCVCAHSELLSSAWLSWLSARFAHTTHTAYLWLSLIVFVDLFWTQISLY